MSLDIVIPTYTKDTFLEDMTVRTILSYKDKGAKIIVTEDGAMFSQKIAELCNTYIWNNQNLSFTGNVNRGLRFSTADFVAVVNSDTELVEGNLLDLCVPGKVTSPVIVNQDISGMAGCFFVVPKEIKEQGLLREEMKTYYSDTEFARRHKDEFQKIETVKISHKQCATIAQIGLEQNVHATQDKYEYDRLS